jgi:putative transposase
MKGFKSPRHVQRFLSTHDQIANVFSRPPPANATDIRSARTRAFKHWAGLTGIAFFLAPNCIKLTVPLHVLRKMRWGAALMAHRQSS